MKKKNSLRCCDDLKPNSVRCLHFKVYGVQWNAIICGILTSTIFGQMTSRKRSCTSEAAVTVRCNFAVIFMELPVVKFKQQRSKGIGKVTTVLALWRVSFGDFLEVKRIILQSIIMCGPLYHQTKTIYCSDSVPLTFLAKMRCSAIPFCQCSQPPNVPLNTWLSKNYGNPGGRWVFCLGNPGIKGESSASGNPGGREGIGITQCCSQPRAFDQDIYPTPGNLPTFFE